MESGRTRPNQEITVKLAQHIDAFENYSRPHSRLMADLAARLAQRLGLLQQDINAIAEAALLHDIGLFQMSPRYLLTPGPLGREDRIDLWRHPIIGEQEMAKRGASRHAQLLVRWHHEWWNGSGYPDMLSLEDIPIGARILRSVDLYSALTSDRPYRPRFEETVAREELRSSAGTECDPYVIHVLLRLLDELQPAVSAPIEAPIEGPVKQQSEDVIEQGAGPFQGRLSEAERIDGSQSTPPTEQLPGDEPVTTQPLGSSPAESAAAETSTLVQAPLPAAENVHSTQPGAGPAESGAQSPAVIQPPETAQSPAARGFTARAPLAIPATRTAPVEICRGWRSSAYNTKSLLGFEVSVLRQLEFRSIAIPMCGWARLVRYLKPWGKQIMSNDPRAWGAAASRAALDDGAAFGDEQITELLEDVYIPGVRFENPALQSWFGEVDGWFMDNLRRRIEALAEPLRSHALALGMRTGDYAQSFPKETLDLKRPLTDVFRNLARTSTSNFAGHPDNRSYNLPVEQFVGGARSELLYLSLPAGHAELAGSFARSRWRESWVRGEAGDDTNDIVKLTAAAQSKQSYLAMVDRILTVGSRFQTWAIECRDLGLASARDLSDLIKSHRPVRATYSKDLTEVAGGHRNYIIVADLD